MGAITLLEVSRLEEGGGGNKEGLYFLVCSFFLKPT